MSAPVILNIARTTRRIFRCQRRSPKGQTILGRSRRTADTPIEMLNQVIIGLLVLVVAAVALRWQYARVSDDVTNPSNERSLFPVATPFVREICRGGGSDCLILPTPDIDY